jgi:hypothetical protein
MTRSDHELRGKGGAPRSVLGRALVVSEVALAVVLVSSASLLLQSFLRLHRLDLGFRAENVLLSEVNLPSSKYPDAGAITRFHRALLEH